MAPKNRLLYWTAIVVLPWTALGHLAGWRFAAGILGLFFVLVLADCALGYFYFVAPEVEFPGTVRLTKGQKGVIEFFARAGKRSPATARIGLPFPPEIVPDREDMTIRLKNKNKKNGGPFKYPCTALERGHYLFERCYMETSSPLGFWALRRGIPIQVEARVYPDMLEERRRLPALFLPRGNFFGMRPKRTVGEGREFEKLREYISGDSYDRIHWKVTAKRGRPATKVFQVEQTQQVYVAIDASRLSARPSGEETEGPAKSRNILDRFIAGALVLELAARRQGDHFGLLAYHDRVSSFFPARSGGPHFRNCREALSALEPGAVTPDFGEIFAFIATKIRRRALLVFLASLDDPVLAEDFLKNAALISRRHLVLVAMIAQDEVRPLFLSSGKSKSKISSVEDIYKRLAGHISWRGLMELEKALALKGVRFSLVESGSLCPSLVSRYMEIKSRQLL